MAKKWGQRALLHACEFQQSRSLRTSAKLPSITLSFFLRPANYKASGRMNHLCVILSEPLPKTFGGAFQGYEVGPLPRTSRFLIEDFFLSQGQRLVLPPDAGYVMVPIAMAGNTIAGSQRALVIVEFALAILCESGHPKLSFAAILRNDQCTEAVHLPTALSMLSAVKFRKMSGESAAQWLVRCFLAHKTNPDHIDVAARRFVRYARSSDPLDALLDLCIALESVLCSQSEVAFRFALSMIKILKMKGAAAQTIAEVFANLYGLRSKLAHGDPDAQKVYGKLQSHVGLIRKHAQNVLVQYVLYLGDNPRKQWNVYLNSLIYG